MERYVLNTDAQELEEAFGITAGPASFLEPTFNAAPGHSLPIIYSDKGVPAMQSATWGITRGKEKITTMHVDEIPVNSEYSTLLSSNACIIPATGFYKWKHSVNDPLPFFIRIHTRDVLGIAGFYMDNGAKRNSFCVLTMEANVLVKPLGNTMPCILNPLNFENWLQSRAAVLLEAGFNDTSLLPEMTVFRVPDLVNNLSNNSPELMQPIPKLKDED